MRAHAVLLLVVLAACAQERAVGGGAGSLGGTASGGAGGAPPVSETGGIGGAAPIASEPDASRTSPLDAATDAPRATDDAGAAQDAQPDEPDAAPPECALEATGQIACTSHLCRFEGETFVAVQGEEPFTVGALSWSASVCEDTLGWASAASNDTKLMIYGLSLAQLSALEAGAPLFVYYAGPVDPPTSPASELHACPLEPMDELPACPETPTAPIHHSKNGCRGPLDPYCAICQEPGGGAYQSSSDGAEWYNVTSVDVPGTCEGYCHGCASCSYRDEDEARALEPRPDCEPCTGEIENDACFDLNGCGCYCETKLRLREACPTLIQ